MAHRRHRRTIRPVVPYDTIIFQLAPAEGWAGDGSAWWDEMVRKGLATCGGGSDRLADTLIGEVLR